MNPATIRAGLASRLATVDGMRVNPEGLATGSVTPAPGKAVTVVAPDRGTFIVRDTIGAGGYALTFVVTLLVGAQMTEAGQKALDTYLATDAANSVWLAIESDAVALGGGGEFASVAQVRAYGDIVYGATTYFGCELVVAVAAQ